jgi:DNA-binding transcriptional ArsR family regulator
MATDPGPEGGTMPAPEEAFAVLGNEIRLEILQRLGEADEPLAYSELFERMDYDDSGNFSYHLDQLVGHFVGRSDGGIVSVGWVNGCWR